MIDVALARQLHAAGLRWRPEPGDRFIIESPTFEGEPEVFTISEMTIEAHHYPTGTELGFNGTTEWALDSVSADDSLWLPREDQLRILLARSFKALTRRGEGHFHVVVTIDGDERGFEDRDAENAYGRALLAYIESALRLDGVETEAEAGA
ncbi:pilus assembly protein CpaE [Frondihabitans cladoniiphilus]|uniref:Pilus assembly protein CpaE n=1 Tax=Frondihabitans cladoniiphilus TaxID=715785 RepID=A0ABP8W421_9MICO